MPHPLEQYPTLIAQATQTLNHVDVLISQCRHSLAHHEAIADREVAFNADLKNELQRKAKRAEILENQDYLNLLTTLAELNQQRSEALITLEQLRGEFSVARLLLKAQIAERLTTIPDAP